MSAASPTPTETNPVLASALALVGLLGVVGALLPPDLLPAAETVATEADVGAGLEPLVEPNKPPVVQEAAGPQPATPVFKPVELEGVSDDMLVEKPSGDAGTQQSAVPSSPAVIPARGAQDEAPGDSVQAFAEPERVQPAEATVPSPSATLPEPVQPVAPYPQAGWPAWQTQGYPPPQYVPPYTPQPQWTVPPQGMR